MTTEDNRRCFPPNCPIIVCLCGSTRFLDTFRQVHRKEALAGHIVLSVECITTADHELQEYDPQTKARLDQLHLRQIELAEEVLVLNVNDYVGESTAKEIQYARSLGKRIRWLEPHRFVFGAKVEDA